MYKKLSAPILVQWEVTPACNHKCQWCYNYWREGPPQKLLPQRYKALYRKTAQELIDNGVFSVVITGDEPLLVIDQVWPYIQMLSDHGINVSLNSNLTLLTEKKLELIKRSGVKTILVSLPSGDPATCDLITCSTGSLERIVAGIKLAQSGGYNPSVNMVVSKLNQHQIDQTARLVASLGLTNFAISKASNPVSNSNFQCQVLELDEFREIMKSIPILEKKYGLRIDTLEANPPCAFGGIPAPKSYKYCSAGKSACAIGGDGEIRPCNRLPISHGNIVDGFSKAWNSMGDYRSGCLTPSECASCKIKSRCGGGCKADALIAYGELNKADPYCDLESLPELKSEPALALPTGHRFVVNPRLKIRYEDFGSILYPNAADWLPVDKRITTLLEDKKVVELADLASVLSVSIDDALSTAAILVAKNILIPKE